MATKQVQRPADLIQLLVESNGLLLVNVYPAVGHVVPEIDNFFRRQRLGEVPTGRPFLLCMPPNAMGYAVAELYRDYFDGVTINNDIFEISKKVGAYYPELTYDIGLSPFKLAPDPQRPCTREPWFNDIMYRLTDDEVNEQWLGWYRRRALTKDFNPLDHNLDSLTPELADFLGVGAEKFAVMQVKDKPTLCVPVPTEASSYLDAIAYLKDHGYTLVHAGREKYREEFRRFGGLDYANSPIASFKHDLMLMKFAKLAMTTGSGIAMLADLMGTPLVYGHYWHIDAMPFSGRCNAVPILLRNRQTGRLERFAEHGRIFGQKGASGNFPWETHEPHSPDGRDILIAVQEALDPLMATRPLSPAQKFLKTVNPGGYASPSEGRVSQAFLERYAELL